MDLASFQREVESFRHRHDELVELGPLDAEPRELLERMSEMMETLRAISAALTSQQASLAETEEALATERGRYEELWNGTPFGLVVTDLQALILRVNEAAAHLLAMRADRLSRKPLTLFVAEEERSEFRQRMLAVAESGVPARWDTRIVAATNAGLHASVWAQLATADRQPREIRWTLLDVTEDRKRERELAAANRELERRVNELTLRPEEKPRVERTRRAG